MLPPEELVLDGRQALLDANRLFAGAATPRGYYQVSWYGSATSDERGSFAVVDPAMGLADCVGEILEVQFYPFLLSDFQTRSVRVYVIASLQDLGTDLGITRRAYAALQSLADEPITANVGIVQ